MSIYLHDIPLDEALAALQENLARLGLAGRLGAETLPLGPQLAGRITAAPIHARISAPHYHASAMDGFAVIAAQTEGALPSRPVELMIGSQVKYVDTGDPLPAWANAVIPIEMVESLDENTGIAANPRAPQAIRIRNAVTPWQHIRPMGEDMVATQLVLPAGHALRPVDLGALAAAGCFEIPVARRPRIAILPTGTELIPIGQQPKEGDIIEFNSTVLAAQVELWGAEARRSAILPDDFEQIRAAVQTAAQTADLVLINAGSSAGSEDYSARVVESLGEVWVHGVAVRPGHPVILGAVRHGELENGMTPVIGVPGYPVSAALTAEIFIQPLVSQWLGSPQPRLVEVDARITRKVTSPAGDDDYLRVVVGEVGGQVVAAPIARGAGVISSLVKADGIVVIPSGSQGLEAGARVKVRLYTPRNDLGRTLMVIGSHDMTLDILAYKLNEKGVRLSSANAGSQGGLIALQRGEAHLAGTHLLDPATGEYNCSAVAKYIPDKKIHLIHWAGRTQGLIVPRGNPKRIASLSDLSGGGLRFVNRQRGAGTRILLDYHLSLAGIAPESVLGYNQEEYTHLAVAVAVASGRADCGLGVAAAAEALGLDFVPLYLEQYDLAIPAEFIDLPLLKPLFDLMHDSRFQQEVGSQPGYDTRRMGTLIAEVG